MIRKVSLRSLCTLHIVFCHWREVGNLLGSAWSLTAPAGAGVYTEPSMSITVTSHLPVVPFAYGQISPWGIALQQVTDHPALF